jgi:integrase/recombinase XerD
MHEALDLFLAHLSADGAAPANTLQAYRTDLTQLVIFLTDRGIVEANVLHPDHLQAFCDWLQEHGYATATIARRIVALRAFGSFLVQTGILVADPCLDLHPPSVTRSSRQVLTPEQFNSLRDLMVRRATPDGWRDRAMLEVLAATALRASDLIALDLADIALETATVTVCARSGKARSVQLTPAAIMALATYLLLGRPALLQDTANESALFLNQQGQRLTRQGCWVILKGYAHQLGLQDLSPELLRQSVAAQRFAEGASVSEVQALLGHAARKTTEVYQPAART